MEVAVADKHICQKVSLEKVVVEIRDQNGTQKGETTMTMARCECDKTIRVNSK